jgi:DNA-binding response OmpR family regulator
VSRVLVVEDEAHLAEGLVFNLENAGYEVRLARSLPDAIEAFERESFDLVVLDRMLPGGDGLDVARAVRRAKNYTPILVLTARNQPEDRVAGLDAGADDYVTKPFELDELLARVRGMLRRQAWTRAGRSHNGEAKRLATLEFGGSRIDFGTLKAHTFAGEEVELSPKEAAIMRLFAEREGEVVTRKLLLEEVWGETAAVETRTTDNFILRLRKYFEPEPSAPRYILSVRGAGYRFVRGGDAGS